MGRPNAYIFPGKGRAAFVLVANDRTRRALPSNVNGRVVTVPENAVDVTQWKPSPTDHGDPTRFVFIGRLVDWKALDVVIRALREVPSGKLDVIGDGTMMAPWKQLTAELGLADRVRFLGWQTQAECAVHLNHCCALVLPSVYECGGAVVLEAMAMGRPVIATAWGGPVDYLDANCGFLIEPTSRPALIAGFATAMQQLIDSPDLRAAMGEAGRARLERDFEWNRKIDRILDIYESCIIKR